MAFHWIGRDDDKHRPTDKDDENDVSETPSASFVNSLPTTSYFEQLAGVPTDTATSAYSYKTMSQGPDWPNGQGNPHATRPQPGRSRPTDNDHPNDGFPRMSTLVTSTSKSKYSHGGFQASTATTTLMLTPTGDSSPGPTGEPLPGLQNNGVNNGSNKIPIYAAAGVTPVVIIVVGLLVFCFLRKRKQQREAAASHTHVEEMKMQPKPALLPYMEPLSPPPAVLPQYSISSPSSPSSSHPPTASSSQPVILGPIPSGNNGAYLTGMDTSDLVSMTSASNISRMGTIVDRDPFADGRSLEEAPPPYRPSSLPPASLASASRNSSIRIAAPLQATSRTHLIERSPFDDPEDDEVSEFSGPTLGRNADAMSDVSDISYQIDPTVGGSSF